MNEEKFCEEFVSKLDEYGLVHIHLYDGRDFCNIVRYEVVGGDEDIPPLDEDEVWIETITLINDADDTVATVGLDQIQEISGERGWMPTWLS